MSDDRSPDTAQVARLAAHDAPQPGPYDDVEEVQPTDDGQVARLADEGDAVAQVAPEQPAASRAVLPELPVLPEPPELPHTGDQVVDEALERLVAVQDDPPADQVETYVGAHRALQDRLADLEG